MVLPFTEMQIPLQEVAILNQTAVVTHNTDKTLHIDLFEFHDYHIQDTFLLILNEIQSFQRRYYFSILIS